MTTSTPPPGPAATDTEVDLLVIGSGTGMAAALAASEAGLSVLVAEKTSTVGGSTARSGGAFWIPANPTLAASGAPDSLSRAREYLAAVVGDTSPEPRWQAFLDHGSAATDMLRRTTPMEFFWTRGYSDYHPENPGGSSLGRTCECKPFDVTALGPERTRLRPGPMAAPVPMPITGADYKWINLLAKAPRRGLPRVAKRLGQGIGGMAVRREYVAGGQALAAGMFAGLIKAGIPVWTRTALVDLITEGDRVTGAILDQEGTTVTVKATRGVILAAGGFDHDMEMRHTHQSPSLIEGVSLGADGNTGDAIKVAGRHGADVALMDQSWWFPAVAPIGKHAPQILLAERSLPGSFMVDQHGKRFINEAVDYMSFGQRVLAREKAGDPVEHMWLVFDQTYRNSYVFAGVLFPRMAVPKYWFKRGIAAAGSDASSLAAAAGLPEDTFVETLERFNSIAANGNDEDFHRGESAYDRYYGDPTVTPNPTLRPLKGPLYAVKVVLSDLGTCGGLRTDDRGRVLRLDGSSIDGLYAIGNTAANAFGNTYPGAGATIGQGIVYGYIVAQHAAGRLSD